MRTPTDTLPHRFLAVDPRLAPRLFNPSEQRRLRLLTALLLALLALIQPGLFYLTPWVGVTVPCTYALLQGVLSLIELRRGPRPWRDALIISLDLALLACVVFNDPQPALPTLTLAALLAGLASLRLSWRGLLLTCFLALLTATVAAGSRSLLSDTDLGAVAATATMVVLLLALVLAFRHHSRDLQLQVARTIADDPATGLGNRWTLYAAAQLLWPLAHRQQMPVTLLYARIDIPGLQPGQSLDIEQADSVAAGFAGIARERLRGSDILVRYAPLEFAFMLLDCPGNQADAIAQQLQARFQHWSQEHGSAATVTIGATWLPTQPLALDLMLTSVDEAMQRARQYRAGTRGAVHVDPEQIRNRATLS